MLDPALEPRAIDLARRRERAVAIEALAGATRAPVVDRPVARPGIEGQQRVVLADPGDVGDAADIHHGDRPRQVAHQSGVEHRHQRRALPARRDVGAAQVVDHAHAQRPREPCAVADLPGEAPLGPVRDGLAVEPDDVERVERQRHASSTRAWSRPTWVSRHGPLGCRRRLVGLLGRERRADQAADLVGIGNGQASARTTPRARRRSRSAPHRRRRPRSRSSGRVHAVEASRAIGRHYGAVLHPRPFWDKSWATAGRRDGGLQVGLHADRARARHGASDAATPRASTSCCRPEPARPISASTAPPIRCMSARCCRS